MDPMDRYGSGQYGYFNQKIKSVLNQTNFYALKIFTWSISDTICTRIDFFTDRTF